MKTGFIGLGNMAMAMIGGMLQKGVLQAEEIMGSAKTIQTMEAVQKRYGIVTASNREVAQNAEILFLAVKPMFFGEVIREIKEDVRQNTVVVSIAPGITMDDLKNLKKAFISLDEDSDGFIEYDTKKITQLNKYNIPSSDENKKAIINENQFMNIMIDNIIDNRKKFGKESTKYESETDTVLCLYCIFRKN